MLFCAVTVCWEIKGGSNISLYLDTISTEIKYTIAKAKNWACFVSSYKYI